MASRAVPAAIAGAGDNAVRRFLEFFAATSATRTPGWPITGPSRISSPGSTPLGSWHWSLMTWMDTDMYRCDNNSGEQAIQACTRVINGRNREPALLARAHAMRGSAKFDINITEALTDFTEAVNLDPTNAWALYNRGAAKLRIGDQSGNGES
jgi:TPR repeat